MEAKPDYVAWRQAILNDRRPTWELINVALTALDDDELWDAICVLHHRATREVLDAGRQLCGNACPQERELGAHILAQLGPEKRAFPLECVGTLLDFLHDDEEPRVLAAALSALGHHDDERIVPAAARFALHAEALVRYKVVHAVTGYDSPLSIATLVELTRDKDDDVREWAMF